MLTNTNNSKLPTSIINLGNKQQLQHHNTANTVAQTQHQIPPRYQPPPQPHGGILKNFGLKPPVSYYPSDINAPHLNIKYPPEVPKLTNIYLPEGIKSSGIPNSSRLIPPRATGVRTTAGGVIGGARPRTQSEDDFLSRPPQSTQTQQQQQHQLQQQQQQQHQQQLQHQQQQQQQQEMLKFVRKSDSEPSPNSTGSGPTSNSNPSRLSVEQNRHFQV